MYMFNKESLFNETAFSLKDNFNIDCKPVLACSHSCLQQIFGIEEPLVCFSLYNAPVILESMRFKSRELEGHLL